MLIIVNYIHLNVRKNLRGVGIQNGSVPIPTEQIQILDGHVPYVINA